jgi:hypothetical protein
MSDTKISTIALYVVAAISLLVILFFYIAPKSVDIDELDARVEQLLTEGVMVEEPVAEAPAEMDSTAVDSLGMADADSTAMAAADDVMMETPMVMPEEIDLRDHLTGWELMVYKRTDYALRWAYILLLITALASIIFPLITIVTDVKAILRLLSILGGAGLLILLAYFVFASDTPIDILGYTGTDNSNPATLKWIGTGLFSTYIIFGVALISILYSEVANLFK